MPGFFVTFVVTISRRTATVLLRSITTKRSQLGKVYDMPGYPTRRDRREEFRPFRAGPSPRNYRSDYEPRNGWEVTLAGELVDVELHQKITDVARHSSGIIYFDSCGGNAYVGLAIATLIRLRGLQVTGIVVGECSSAALLPLAACSTRYVTKHSTLLFHPIRWQSSEHIRLEEAVEWARHFQHMEADQDLLLGKLFGCPQSLIDEWTRPGRFVTGQEMVAAGLAQMLDLFSGSYWDQVRDQRN